MATTITTRLERELESIREQIDELREYDYEIAEHLHAAGAVGLRALRARLLRRDIARRIEQLKLRNNMLRNGYLAAGGAEERLHACRETG